MHSADMLQTVRKFSPQDEGLSIPERSVREVRDGWPHPKGLPDEGVERPCEPGFDLGAVLCLSSPKNKSWRPEKGCEESCVFFFLLL